MHRDGAPDATAGAGEGRDRGPGGVRPVVVIANVSYGRQADDI
jgi:hypothetical protein